jgi:hypothetical protein
MNSVSKAIWPVASARAPTCSIEVTATVSGKLARCETERASL